MSPPSFLLISLDELHSDANMTLQGIDLKLKSTIPTLLLSFITPCMLTTNGPDEKSIIAVEAARIYIRILCVLLNNKE
jgi:hypothetical protein